MKDTFSSESRRRVIVCPPLIERRLRDKGQRIEIAEELQKIAQSLRQPYIDYIGKLSLENNSILWWVGSLSEKNPWVSKTFLYICYIRLFQILINSNSQEALVFLCENKALRRCLVKSASGFNKWEIHCIEPLGYTILESLRNALRIVVYKGYFVVRSIYWLLLAKQYRLNQIPKGMVKGGEGMVLLRAWIDQRSFDAKGEYHDNHFGGLARHLRSRGKSVVIAPYILRTVSYRQTLKKMGQSSENFLVSESFLKISDIFRVLVRTLANTPRKRAYPSLEGIEVSEIINDDLRRDWARTSIASSLLYYEVVRRWRNAGIPIDTFIYPYENQVWEKACCMALREFYPSTKIIGYQHATVPKMLLNYFFSKDELPILPFPDKVITTGKYTERLFKGSGYAPEKVVCGGAIRYESVTKKRKVAIKKDTPYPVILVTPSIDKNETVELVWKVLKAFGQRNNHKVILKFHPAIPYSNIARDLSPLPEHFIISDKPVSELLREGHVLLYNSSATCIEALSLGVPVLHIGSDFTIDRDNLSDFPSSIKRSARNKEDIVRMTKEILEMDEKDLSQQRVIWEDVVSEIFGPVDESVFDLFL